MPGFYLIPAVASGVLFVLSWQSDLLSRPGFVGAWYVAGVALQFVLGGPFTWIWLAGLLMNVVLGLYLAIRLKLS